MNKVNRDSVEQIILLRWPNVLELNVGYFFNVSEKVFLAFQVNCQTNSFFAGSSCSAGSMNVIIDFFWWLKLDDKVNAGNVQSTGSNVC